MIALMMPVTRACPVLTNPLKRQALPPFDPAQDDAKRPSLRNLSCFTQG